MNEPDLCYAEVTRLRASNAELLAALGRIAACDDGDNPHTIEDDDHDPFLIARAAIAKAEQQ